MTILLLLTGLVAIAVPGIRPAVLLRAHPRSFTRLASLAVGVGLACVLLALLLSVAVGLLHLEFGHRSGGPDHLAPEGTLGAVIAAVVLTILVIRAADLAVRSHRTTRRARPDAWLGHHHRTGGHDLTVLPTPEPIAFSIAGRRRTTIVISEGLQASLDEHTLRLVIDHELAHARAHDRRLLLLARCLDALAPAAPFAGRSSAAMRIAAERAADEEATGIDPALRARLAAHLARPPGALARCELGCGSYRAEQLVQGPSRAPVTMAGAVGGLLVIGMIAVAVLAHATNDISPYLALLAG
ncbi:MAG: M48 family metalloprotease [Acidimicrobiales bacterium]|nr:M48 family metalloprotease [Acidimicrobiales bacterium]